MREASAHQARGITHAWESYTDGVRGPDSADAFGLARLVLLTRLSRAAAALVIIELRRATPIQARTTSSCHSRPRDAARRDTPSWRRRSRAASRFRPFSRNSTHRRRPRPGPPFLGDRVRTVPDAYPVDDVAAAVARNDPKPADRRSDRERPRSIPGPRQLAPPEAEDLRATASAPARLGRSSRPPERSSPASSTWRPWSSSMTRPPMSRLVTPRHRPLMAGEYVPLRGLGTPVRPRRRRHRRPQSSGASSGRTAT